MLIWSWDMAISWGLYWAGTIKGGDIHLSSEWNLEKKALTLQNKYVRNQNVVMWQDSHWTPSVNPQCGILWMWQGMGEMLLRSKSVAGLIVWAPVWRGTSGRWAPGDVELPETFDWAPFPFHPLISSRWVVAADSYRMLWVAQKQCAGAVRWRGGCMKALAAYQKVEIRCAMSLLYRHL